MSNELKITEYSIEINHNNTYNIIDNSGNLITTENNKAELISALELMQKDYVEQFNALINSVY